MQNRTIGKSDLHVAPLAFGGNVFGWTVDEATSFKLLDAFVAGGFNLIDTADMYSTWAPGHVGGESETVVGKWLKARGNRRNVVIATKVGGDMGEGKNLRKDYILRAVENSLKRLRTDYIDLYQTHWDDLETPVTETLEALDMLVKNGELSFREREVLRCFLAGMSVTQIALKFERSIKTISTQKQAAYKKLGVRNDNEIFKIRSQFES